MAGSKVFCGDCGVELRVNTEIDLSGATKAVLRVRKPNKSVVEWDATVSGTILTYTTVAGDLAADGDYVICAYVEFGASSKHYGEAVELEVCKPFST
jgi:hypothetical protein